MKSSKFEQGLQKLSEVDGTAGENVINALRDIAPDLGKYIVEFAFGDIYCRDEVTLQEREMITLSSLLAQGGCETQLEVHINGALNVGITPKKVIETFMQCIPYTGFPRVLNAVGVARKVFNARNETVDFSQGR